MIESGNSLKFIPVVFAITTAATLAFGCQKRSVTTTGDAVALRVIKLDSSEDWGQTSPLPFSETGKIFTIEIEPASGSFDGWVKIESNPGEIDEIYCNPPICDSPCPPERMAGRNVRIDAAGVQLCVVIRPAFGRTHIIATDIGYEPAAPAVALCRDGIDNDGDGQIDFGSDAGCAYVNDNSEQEGSGIVGISPEIRFANPRVENVQGYASSSPLARQAVTINYLPSDATTGRIVVTQISPEGFYFSDIDPLRPGAGHNSLYAYNFNTPWGMRECDILAMVNGIVSEFLGFTELNYPAWEILPICSDGMDNDGDGLVDTTDPECIAPYDMSETPLPPDMDTKSRVPFPTLPSECPIPQPTLLTPEIIRNAPAMEALEAGLVQLGGGTISSEYRNCDHNRDGVVNYDGVEGDCLRECNENPNCTELAQYWLYGQWVVNAGGAKLFVVSRDTFPEFDPMEHRGSALRLLRGTLKQIEFIEPPWIVEVRCRDDLVLASEGREIKPIYSACVPPKARGEMYESH